MLSDILRVWHVIQDLQQQSFCVAGHESGHLSSVLCIVISLTCEGLVYCWVIESLSHGYKLNMDMRAWQHCRSTATIHSLEHLSRNKQHAGAFLIFTLQGLSRRDYRQGHLRIVMCVHTISTWTSTASALLCKLDTSSAKDGNSVTEFILKDGNSLQLVIRSLIL